MELQTVLLLFVLGRAVAGNVIETCACKIDGPTVDCSGIKLSYISDILSCIPVSVKKLELNNNNISDIAPRTFVSLSNLQILRLDYNAIEYLRSGAFEGLAQLETLQLSYNRLRQNNSYPQDVFKPLPRLRELYLQGNILRCDDSHRYNCQYPDMAISTIRSLQHLHIDGLPNTHFGTGFAKLKQLYSLHLDDGYCKIPILTQNTFKSFSQTPLAYLKLNYCDIKYLAPNTFRGLRHLTTLIILNNPRLCLDSIENATVGLGETNIKTIQFNHWCDNPAFYPVLSKDNFQGLTKTSLKVLNLYSNKIRYIDPTVIRNLPKTIEYFSLKENYLRNAKFFNEFTRLENLHTFDGSYQSHFQSGISLKMEINDKRSNVTSEQESNISFGGKMKAETNSKFSFLAFRQGSIQDSIVYLPRNLQIVYMDNVKLGYPVPAVRFGPNKLQHLDSSSCMLRAFLGPWYGLTNLKVFNLSFNRFDFFHPLSLTDMGNLTSLYLQGNKIGKSLYLDTKCKTFSGLKKLNVLDLSNNVIKDIPYWIFKNQINLKILSLADNALRNISFSLKFMENLRHFDLSGNEIEYISKENMYFLDQVAAKGKLFLNLSGNVLSCGCDNQDFVNWFAMTKVTIVDKDDLYCLYRNNSVVKLSKIEMIRLQLKYECSSWIVLTSCVITFVILLLLITLVASLYYKRWQLRYLWYIGRLKIDPFYNHAERQALSKFDAYISYEQYYDVTKDVTLHQIITNNVYPYFERQGYTIKIREEFDGNEKLYHAIPQAVRKSRKVVAILTESYCDDYWNTFEFNIAAYEGIYTRQNIIIPILLGDISNKNLTPEICSFVRAKIESKEVIRLSSQGNLERNISALNERLEQLLRL